MKLTQINAVYRSGLLTLAGLLILGFSSAQANTILIDFGPTATTSDTNGDVWNNFTTVSSSATALSTSTGASSGLSLSYTAFSSGNGGGTSGTAGNISGVGGYVGTFYPSSATTDYNYELNAGESNTLTLTGLNPSLTYTFTYLTSRSAGTANRDLTMTFTGGGSPIVSGPTDANGNLTLVTVPGVTSDGSGDLSIFLQAIGAPSNQQAAYINFIQIDSVSAVPEPSTVALSIIGGLGLLFVVIRRKKFAKI